MMLKDIQETGVSVIRVLVKKTEEKEGKRGPYTAAVLTDGEQEISVNAWVPLSAFPYQGKVVDAELACKNGFVNINRVYEVPNADISAYIPHAPVNRDACYAMIRDTMDHMKNTDLKLVVRDIMEKHKEKFLVWSAAKSVHHNYISGLLYHTCRMLSCAKYVSAIYNLDSDMLAAGVILHDVGKLYELDMDVMGNSEYTVKGNLFGHLYLGAEMINSACRVVGVDPESETMLLLKHMIVSHHNKQELGAVRMSATKEAYVLSMLDLLDSRVWIMEAELQKMEPGKCSGPIRVLDGACVYNPNNGGKA